MNHQICYIDSYDMASDNKTIALVYRHLLGLKVLNFVEKIAPISAFFIGRPYILGATGEGGDARFDQASLYRFDVFDCVTYVNAVLALALSQDVDSFQKNLIRIAYCDKKLEYAYRHHFMSVDWNVRNQAMGFVKDITRDIVDASGNSIAQIAEALIDRPSWFRHRHYGDIRLLQKISNDKAEALLEAMRDIAVHVKPQKSHLPYLPLSEMFDRDGNPKMSIFQQIPQGTIIEIVRPDWDLKEKIGTHLNVSHVGFAIWEGEQLFYRQASSLKKQVCDIPLAEYLRQRLDSSTIKGINVQRLL